MDGENSRINFSIKKMLKLLHSIFRDNFLSHVAFIITKWSQSKKDIEIRKSRGATEDLKISDINSELIELGIRKETDEIVKCFFINNMIELMKDQEAMFESLELEMHQTLL